MNRYLLALSFLFTLLLAGCNAQETPLLASAQPSSVLHPSQTPRPVTPTPTLQPAETLTPLPTFTPTRTSLPTHTPTVTPTPAPWGSITIGAENASALVQRASWGLGSIQDYQFTPDGETLVVETPLGIYIYRAADLHAIIFLSTAHQFHIAPAGDLLFARLPDGSIQVVELPAGEVRYTLTPIARLSAWMNDEVYAQPPAQRAEREALYFDIVSSITALTVDENGSTVAIGFGDTSIGIWALDSGALIRELRSNIIQGVSELVFSPDGSRLLVNGYDGEIAIWQVTDGTLLWRLPHIGHSVGQPFSPDGSLIALETTADASNASWVTVRNAQYGDELGEQVVGALNSNAISPDNTRLVTTWYSQVSIWTIPNLNLVDRIETGLNWPRASFSADGVHILINGGEQAYLSSDFSRDSSYPVFSPPPVPAVDFNALEEMGHGLFALGFRYPDAEHILTWGFHSDQQAWVRNLADNSYLIYDFDSPLVAAPNLSFNGDRLAACTEAGLVVIDLASSQASNLGRCRGDDQVLFSVDGSTIFRTNNTLIDALDSQTGELLYNLRGHEFLVESMALTQDGSYLVSASNFQRTRGREVIWWRVDQPARLWSWWVNVYQNERLEGAVFQLDGNVLHTALGGLRSWRLGDGVQHHLDSARIASLAISPDQRLLAAGDYDGLIHIWDLETWEEVATLTGPLQVVHALTFSPDGASLVSASADGTIRLWALP